MCIKCYIYVCMCYCAIVASAEQSGEPIVVLGYNTDANNEEDKSIEIINYDTDEHLTFSCDFEKTQQDVISVKLIHQWRGLDVSAAVTQAIHNVTYSIFADVLDHESEVYCIWKIMKNNASFIKSRRVRLIRRSDENNISKKINTTYYDEINSAYNVCQESGTNQSMTYMRKIVDDIVYSVSLAKEVSLTPSDSGVIFYCETNILTYKKPNNEVIYTRQILSKTKYVYAMHIYPQIGIGVAVVAVLCILLMAGILLYRSKHKPPDVFTQNIYAELELPESTRPQPTRNLSQSIEEGTYVQIIGLIGRNNNNTTGSVAYSF